VRPCVASAASAALHIAIISRLPSRCGFVNADAILLALCGAGNGSEPAIAAGSLEDRVLLRITAAGLSFNAQHFEFSELEALTAPLLSRADPVSVVLIPEAAVRIQDIVSVMAALNAAGVGTVELGVRLAELDRVYLLMDRTAPGCQLTSFLADPVFQDIEVVLVTIRQRDTQSAMP